MMRPTLEILFSILISAAFLPLALAHDNPKSSKPSDQNAGIVTDDSFTEESLVRDIFVKGSCDNVANIKAIGNSEGIGYFENGSEIIGLERGIILSTGHIKGAEGPNSDTRKSGNFNDNSGDKDLKLLVTDRVFDAAGIEFDFIPLDSFVAFRYVFASEEYCEFVGREFNDAFGFFVSGPGINGDFSNQSKNVALIPGTEDFVAINSVNHKTNEEFYISNITSNDASSCGVEFTEHPNLQLIEYDGYTAVLEATLKLIPCETYHIRFVVADVGDNFYDSAVFLEAGSFNLGGEVLLSTDLGPEAAPGEIYSVEEGCDTGYFIFERADLNTTRFPLTVNFKASDLSTAVPGMDYDSLPRSVTIPAGETVARLPVPVFNDFSREGPETLILELDIPCACYTGVAEMEIQDSPLFTVQLNDMLVCKGDEALLAPSMEGGTPPFTYQWEDGTTRATRSVLPASTSAYAITITDACQNFVERALRVEVKEAPAAFISGQREICEGDTALLPVEFQGEPPYEITYSRNNVIEKTIRDIYDNPYFLPVSGGGTFAIADFSDSICFGDIGGTAEVLVKRFEASWETTPVSCVESADGTISVAVEGGKPPYRFTWSSGSENTPAPAGLTAGEYQFTVTDSDGCAKGFAARVAGPVPIEPVAFRCEDLSRGVVQVEASGGEAPYTYSVGGSTFQSNELFRSLIPGATYDLTIRDNKGCMLRQPFTMPAPFLEMVDIPSEIRLDIGENFPIDPSLGIPETLVREVVWSPPTFLSCADCLTPVIAPLADEFYTVRVVDQFGCAGTASTTVKVRRDVKIFVPDAFSPNGDDRNERLTVFANAWQVTAVKDFQVFDRWGTLVFQNSNFAPNDEISGWNGRHNGSRLPTGIYVYVARAELIDGTEEVLRGQVLLLN